MLKTLRIFKKLKYMDDPKVAEKLRLTTLRDEWLIACEKPTSKIKTRMKKTAKTKKKKVERRIRPKKKLKERTRL